MENVLKEVITRNEKNQQKKLKVLILEDRLTDVELVKLHFEELDFLPEYRVTETKEKYLQYLRQYMPDIVISDFNLPNFDGLKALDILRNQLQDDTTPFVFVTGTLGEENAVKAIKGGATDFIVKERMHQLPAAIIKALREKQEKLLGKEASRREYLKERRFKKLVQEGSDLISITDADGVIMFSSDNHENILGCTPQSLKGADSFKLIHPDDLGKVKTSLHRLKHEKSTKIDAYRIIDSNKQWRWIQSTATNLLSDEAIAGIVINSVEITELIEKERDLILSNEKYYLATLATQDLIYDWDLLSGKIIRDGQAINQMFGYDPNSLQNESFWKTKIHPDDVERVYHHLTSCLKDNTQTKFQQEYRFRRSDGSHAYLHDKSYILRDKEGTAIRLIGATRDISVQKEKEQVKDLTLILSKQIRKPKSLAACANEVLKTLSTYLGIAYAELWLPASHHKNLNLISQYAADSSGEAMFNGQGQMAINEGLPGKTFHKGEVAIWRELSSMSGFERKEAAKKAKLVSAIGMPIMNGNQSIGIFIFFSKEKDFNFDRNIGLLEEINSWISPELQRKQAHEELDKFFSGSADLLSIIGTNGFFKKVNPAFTKVLGYSEKEFLEMPLNHFVHPDDLDLTKSQLDKLINEERSVHFEIRNITKDGRIRWISWSAIIQSKDEVVFIVGQDITEKKRLEELVEETQSMAKIGSWELDLINKTLHWTPQTKDIHEVDEDYQPTLEKAIHLYKEGMSRRTIEKCVKEAIERGKPWDEELQIITAKGNEKWVRCMGKVEMSEEKCIRLYGVFQDIEDQKKREENLKISYRRFALAAKATREAIYEWDCQSNILHWTENYQILFGYNIDNEDFNTWKSKVHHLDHDRIIQSLDKLMENPDQNFWKNEYRFIKKDKKIAFVEERGYVIRDEKGKPMSMIGSVQDVTEKKMFQERLLENTIQSQEKERNRIAQELHDGIVQEMVVCSMRCNLLTKSIDDKPELTLKVQDLTQYIKQITDNTRDISHNLLSANISEMTFVELLERLDLNLRIMSNVKINIDHFLDTEMVLDEEVKINLYRVIQELTNNIIKHSGASKALILVEKIKDSISVKVHDNGKGINQKQTSNGIGLANVRNRINMIGGTIDFKNGVNGGLEVDISIPMVIS